MALEPFSDEQARVIVSLKQAYQVWIETLRMLNDLPYNMRIKEVSGREYLYEVTDRLGSMKSKGRLGSDKQAEFDHYETEKAKGQDMQKARDRSDASCLPYWRIKSKMTGSYQGSNLDRGRAARTAAVGLMSSDN